MQLNIQEIDSVSKRVTVDFSASDVATAFAQVYAKIGKQVSLPGFRKGKVPTAHLRKRFSRDAAGEVVQLLVEKGWRGVLDEDGLLPLSEPKFDLTPIQEGQAYSFSMAIEVPPKFEIKGFDSLSVERQTWTANDDAINHELVHLAENFASYETVEDRTVSQDGDMLTFDYAGRIDDVAFEGGTASGASLVLGSNQFIPGFEAQCVGQTVGEDFDVVVSFPADYQAQNLAGKEATFGCKISELKIKKVPEVGQALADAAGEPDLDALKAKVKAGIEDRQNEGSLAETREKLRALVGQQYDFDVPESLTQSSFEDRKKRAIDSAVREGQSTEKAEADFESKRDETLADVKSSMRAMFVLDELGRKEEIEVEPLELMQEIEKLAASMGPYGFQLKQLYQDPERRAVLARRLKHDKVLDFILTQANVTDIDMTVPVHEDGEHQEGTNE